MPRILVVDDNPVDRKLISRLLEAQPGWHVETAVSGNAALEHLAANPVDLVVTDLQMPGINGVQLAREIRQSKQRIPVLLVTAFGSEQEALAALQAGAANFSHKSRLNLDLVPTASTVLDWSEKINSWSHPDSTESTEIRMAFVLANDVNQVPRLLEMFSDRLPGWARPDELRILTALDEALTNAICHGNLEVDSALKDDADMAAYSNQVSGRQNAQPWCGRRVRVEANFSPSEIQFQIRDEGPGFDPDSLPDPTAPENIVKAGGRGLLLIRTFMDQVDHNPTGNEITLIKRSPLPGANSQ